jgi:uncharacterized protein
MAPDINILVAAFRPDHPQHAGAQRWLTGALEAAAADDTLEILPMVAVGFLRVVTNPRVTPSRMATAEAIAFLDAIIRLPGVALVDLGPEWSVLEAQCLRQGLRGGIISDAWIAAAVSANDLHLVTFDADFRRLLRSDQFTLLPSTPGVQESRVLYLAA